MFRLYYFDKFPVTLSYKLNAGFSKLPNSQKTVARSPIAGNEQGTSNTNWLSNINQIDTLTASQILFQLRVGRASDVHPTLMPNSDVHHFTAHLRADQYNRVVGLPSPTMLGLLILLCTISWKAFITAQGLCVWVALRSFPYSRNELSADWHRVLALFCLGLEGIGTV